MQKMGWVDAFLHVDVDRDNIGEEDVEQRDEGGEDGGLANPAAGLDSARSVASVALQGASVELKGVGEPDVEELLVGATMIRGAFETKGVP